MEKQSEVKDHNDHLEKVKKQIEYYFSAENLINDTFLASQMDSEKSVPISTVMNFSKLKALTEDEEIIRRSLDTSIIVSVFDNRIRLNSDITSKQVGQRSTIILREITSDVSEDEIKEIFNYEGCKAIQSLRSDIENTWFVVMESEEDAKETILQLQLHKRCIRGERVKARVKPESKIRAFFPTPPQPLIPIVPMPFLPYPAFEDPRMFPFNLQGMQMSMEQTDEIAAHDGQVKQNEKRTHGENHGKKHHSPSDKDSHTKKSHTKKDGSGSGSKGRGGKNNDRKSNENSKKVTIHVDTVNFPPLPDSDGSPSAKGSLSNIQNVSSETENNTNPNVDTAIVISPSTPVDANNKHSGSWAAILKATPTPTDSPQKINKASSEPSPEKHQMKDSHPNTSELNVKTSNITDTLNSTFQSATFVVSYSY